MSSLAIEKGKAALPTLGTELRSSHSCQTLRGGLEDPSPLLPTLVADGKLRRNWDSMQSSPSDRLTDALEEVKSV